MKADHRKRKSGTGVVQRVLYHAKSDTHTIDVYPADAADTVWLHGPGHAPDVPIGLAIDYEGTRGPELYTIDYTWAPSQRIHDIVTKMQPDIVAMREARQRAVAIADRLGLAPRLRDLFIARTFVVG